MASNLLPSRQGIRSAEDRIHSKASSWPSWSHIIGLIPVLTYSARDLFLPPVGLLALVWVAICLLQRVTQRDRFSFLKHFSRGGLLLLFFWLGAALSSTILYAEGYRFVVSRFIFLIMIFWVFDSIRGYADFTTMRTLLFCSVAIISILTLVHSYGIVEIPFADKVRGRKIFAFLPHRTLGIRMSYGEYGIIAGVTYGLLFAHLFGRGQKKVSFYYWLLLPLLIFGTGVAQSRSTFLGFTFQTAIFFSMGILLQTLNRRGRAVGYLVLTGAIGLLVSVGIDSIGQFLYEINVKTVGNRFTHFGFAIETFLEQPLTGYGYGTFSSVYESVSSKVVLHNGFLNELFSVGLFWGLVMPLLWLWTIGKYWKIARSMHVDNAYRSIAVGMLSACGFAIVELNFFQGFFVEIQAVIIALAVRLDQWSTTNFESETSSKRTYTLKLKLNKVLLPQTIGALDR